MYLFLSIEWIIVLKLSNSRSISINWRITYCRLLKLKEEMLERILFKKRHLDCQSKPEMDANLNKMYKNFVTSSTTSTDQKVSSLAPVRRVFSKNLHWIMFPNFDLSCESSAFVPIKMSSELSNFEDLNNIGDFLRIFMNFLKNMIKTQLRTTKKL